MAHQIGFFGRVVRPVIGVAVALAVLAGTQPPSTAQAAAADVTIDFGTALRTVPRSTFSADITGYGYQHYITNDPQHRAMLTGLYGSARMQLVYTVPGDPTSDIVAGGAGADRTVSGDDWVSSIRALGAEPMIIVPEDPVDAANLVRHFNSGARKVTRWVVGNEPDPRMDAATYSAKFNAVHDAMKAVDPAISVGGPAVSNPNMDYIRDFLVGSGSRTDFVDFHKYGAGEFAVCDSALLAATPEWGADVTAVRALIQELAPARAARIGVQIGETNSDWGVHPSPAGCDNIGSEAVQYRNTAIWWAASVFGHLARAGAWGFAYGDKNGALGLLYDQPNPNGAGMNERMPVYQGLGFYTGQQGTSLAHFGSTLVKSSTTLEGVEVFASNNPKVVVIVNKGTTERQAVISVGSEVTTAKGHQKDGQTVSYATPAPLGAKPVVNGTITVTLPGPSVTQLVLS
ncbi:hypothetical protein Misp01_77590 [Microtetraspora sp. NBRC 13810]|uniref:hypothetical protein n=1 Tax=Microtetraspora sp. NBRC 13810 TaxID=3030990 RepID=UPI0024A4C176|nr:hypothetical protein [Microtetraspora sp. NBRC 13810]GLW12631.1 hypothetical protein Misp01_77590 [Microtetraspora sp. NBRC 13810]